MTYYYSDGTDKFGPMALEEAAQKIIDNADGRNLVWKPGMDEWAAPEDVPELLSILAQKQALHPPAVPPEQVAQFTVQEDPPAAPPRVEPSAQTAGKRPAQLKADRPEPYPKCPLGKRFVAWVIDGIIASVFIIPSIIIMISAFGEPKLAVPLFLLSIMLLVAPVLYGLLRDGLGEGQSWGKQLMGLMVVDLKNGEPCSKAKSAARNVIAWLLSMFPYVGWLVEPIIVLADDKGRRLGDRAADTMVIEVTDYTKYKSELRRRDLA